MTNGDLLKIGRVLRVKAELTEGWLSATGRNFVARYAAHTGENEKLAYDKLLREVRDSSPIYVSSEICELLEASVGSWPEKFTLKAEDVPLRQGFVMFETPLWLPMQEWQGKTIYMPLSYVAWFWDTINYGPGEKWNGREALAYSFYQDTSSPNADGPTGVPMGVFHSSGWLFGDDQDWGHIMKRDVTMKPSTTERVKFSTRYLMSLLRFISQEILVSAPVPGREVLKNKSAARKVKESLNLTDLPNIHVVRLRKRVRESLNEASGEPKEVHWSHRWVVGSHWHNYYYRSTGEHRPRWVWAYEKGPEGAPLVPKKPAYMVNR